MKDDYQGAYIMALKMVIPNGELWDKVYSQLVQRLKKDGMQTGFFATEHILPLLADHSDAKLAFDLLLDQRCGGWMYQVRAGATTTWERWDAIKPDGTVNETKSNGDNMVSFNHYSFGSVGKFYYQYILGIKPMEPGFTKLRIQSHIDSRIGNFSGSYRDIHVSFDGAALHISTPADTQIILPDGSIHEVNAGSYDFSVKEQ